MVQAPMTRPLGRSGIDVSALGLGCWAMGGQIIQDGQVHGFGHTEDERSLRGIRRALDLGVNFFDTADIYGCGHSERLLAQALGADRSDVIIATKFGHLYDEDRRQVEGTDGSMAYVRWACEASLRRLGTDYIDLYLLHVNDYPVERAAETRDALEGLVAEGKIRWYGWSTDYPERAEVIAEGRHCVAIQQNLNFFDGDTRTLALCEQLNLASVNRRPLGLGLLTGKFHAGSTLPKDDPRVLRMGWSFGEGETAAVLTRLDAIRQILTSGGRTLAQGALCWIWGRSDSTIPIPGYTTVEQVEENVGAMQHGPLSAEEMRQIEEIIGSADARPDLAGRSFFNDRRQT
jgi:aryl-alcohol dehydrogenase-like predicted oxidoreductase